MQINALKKEREELETSLKNITIDFNQIIVEKKLENNQEEACIQALNDILSPTQNNVLKNLQEQERLIEQMQELDLQKPDSSTDAREDFLRKASAAYDVYLELQKNLKEGTQFYNELTEILLLFQNKVKDYCFARNMEKEELIKSITAIDLNSGNPHLPGYHLQNLETNSASTYSTFTNSNSNLVPNPSGLALYGPTILPHSFNPYATLPYPQLYQFPQHPNVSYGTWPRSEENPSKK